jgi:hypothetical protein
LQIDPLNGEAAALMLKQEEKYKAKVAGLLKYGFCFFIIVGDMLILHLF